MSSPSIWFIDFACGVLESDILNRIDEVSAVVCSLINYEVNNMIHRLINIRVQNIHAMLSCYMYAFTFATISEGLLTYKHG